MLSKPLSLSRRHGLGRRVRQQGVVMMVALVVLVVMTLAGIGLMRSMDTTNLIAGNMAFKQAALHASDPAVEAAIGWLETNAGAFLDGDQPNVGYKASSPNNAGLSLGEKYWTDLAAGGVCNLPITGGVCSSTATADATTGNQTSFMIHRLCDAPGNRVNVKCPAVTGSVVSSGSNEGPEGDQLTGTSVAVFYRITVRVLGPRNTVSYAQAVVSM